LPKIHKCFLTTNGEMKMTDTDTVKTITLPLEVCDAIDTVLDFVLA
jgi:hypothetical protein